MFARVVSNVLVAAVFVCPLNCGAGLCLLFDSSADASCAPSIETHCCCCDTAEGGDEHESQGAPDTLMCQGVCGGAVFEKPCELDGPEPTFDEPQFDDQAFRMSFAVETVGESFEFPECVRAGNQGRFVRILHLSFLC